MMERQQHLLVLPLELRHQILSPFLPSFEPGETIQYNACQCGENLERAHKHLRDKALQRGSLRACESFSL